MRAETAIAAVVEAAKSCGFDVDGCRILRVGDNAAVVLPAAGVRSRPASVNAWETPDPAKPGEYLGAFPQCDSGLVQVTHSPRRKAAYEVVPASRFEVTHRGERGIGALRRLHRPLTVAAGERDGRGEQQRPT